MSKTNQHEVWFKALDSCQTIIARLSTIAISLRAGAPAALGVGLISPDLPSSIHATVFLILVWLLDSYYLNRERAYRDLFEKLVGLAPRKRNRPANLRMDASRYQRGSIAFFKTMCGSYPLGIYPALLAFIWSDALSVIQL